jgi:hypothetical protein
MSVVERPLPAVQRAYFYAVALVAIHMLVLGVANLLRVGAEIALNAPSGGFTGLPFVFAEFNRPRELYREQASLAIALLLVGVPAWLVHFRTAQAAALRDAFERVSALRSLYIHVVVFITALLVFGYGQRAFRLVLQGTTFGSTPAFGPDSFGLESNWEARAAGAGVMALTSALVLAYHLRLSWADRLSAGIRGRAAEVRQLALYALVVIGIFFFSFTTVTTIDGIWRRVVDAFVPLSGIVGAPQGPPGARVPMPSRDDFLRFQLLGAIPAIVAGLVLWLGTWIPLQRGLVRGPDVDVERRSVVRKFAIYLVVFVAALAVLIAATFISTSIGRRLLGDPVVESFSSLWHELGFPVTTAIVFGTLWLFHRRVVESEAARETEVARAATIRRLYTYLIAAIGLAMAAIGAAGIVGVIGSQLIGLNTHDEAETAAYASLLLVGLPAWGFHWRQAQLRLDGDERRSVERRGYLYLVVLGGVLGALVFGSAALYRLLNATLAFSFTTAAWHDIWHFSVDAAVSAAAFLTHLRFVRADRVAAPEQAAAPDTYAFLVRLPGADLDAARSRLATGLPSDASVTAVRVAAGGPGLVAAESLTPIEGERGPSVLAIIVAVVALLVVLVVVPRIFFARLSGPPPVGPVGTTAVRAQPPPPPHGALLWSEPGRAVEPGTDITVSRALTLPAIIELEVTVSDRARRERGESPTFEWTLREDTRGALRVRLDAAVETGRLMLDETSVGPTVSVPAVATGRVVRLTVLLERGHVVVWADKWFLGEYIGPAADASLRLRATGEPGAVTLIEMRAYEVY